MTSNELDYARELVGDAIVAPDHYLDIITVACALTHKIDDVFTAPRILALGEKGSGKSTVLTVANYLSANAEPVTGVLAMTAPSYVADFRMNPKSTHVIDEVNHLFGEAGSSGKHNKFYTYMNQGYRRDTAFAQCQENKTTLRVPIFGVVFMAGLGLACPPDLRERSVVIRMTKAAGKQRVADFSLQETRDAFAYGHDVLKSWAQRTGKLSVEGVRGLHPDLVHRTMDVWGPLFAVAMAAGQEWTDRLLVAFERIELEAGVPMYAPQDQLFLDYLAFTEATGNDYVACALFMAFAYDQSHGAYAGMKPGQFARFTKPLLGPTVPFWEATTEKSLRGWTSSIHLMNVSKAQALKDDLEAKPDVTDSEMGLEEADNLFA